MSFLNYITTHVSHLFFLQSQKEIPVGSVGHFQQEPVEVQLEPVGGNRFQLISTGNYTSFQLGLNSFQ